MGFCPFSVSVVFGVPYFQLQEETIGFGIRKECLIMADNASIKDLIISKDRKNIYETVRRESMEKYDRDYFEKGIITGKSCYMYYSWMPEQTLRMVYHLITRLPIKTSDRVLDFGCAK